MEEHFRKNPSKFAYDAEESEALDSLTTLNHGVVWLGSSNVMRSLPVYQYMLSSVS